MNVVYIICTIVLCLLIIGVRQRSKNNEEVKATENDEAAQIYDKEIEFIKQCLKLAYNSENCYSVLKNRLLDSIVGNVNPDQRLLRVMGVLSIAYMQGDDFNDANNNMQKLAMRFLADADFKNYTWTLMMSLGVAVATMKETKLLNSIILTVKPEWLMALVEKEMDD